MSFFICFSYLIGMKYRCHLCKCARDLYKYSCHFYPVFMWGSSWAAFQINFSLERSLLWKTQFWKELRSCFIKEFCTPWLASKGRRSAGGAQSMLLFRPKRIIYTCVPAVFVPSQNTRMRKEPPPMIYRLRPFEFKWCPINSPTCQLGCLQGSIKVSRF